MPEPNPSALDFLLSRRSRPAKTLGPPVPRPEEIRTLLTAAARSPDHGKLEPWRFLVLRKAALERLAREVSAIGSRRGRDADETEKQRRQFADADLVIAVISSPKPSAKIPDVEQLLSSGAVCLALLNAALVTGWGANWLTGWAAHEPEFRRALGLAEHERIAGFVHIGTESATPPERPRPDIDALTTWVEA